MKFRLLVTGFVIVFVFLSAVAGAYQSGEDGNSITSPDTVGEVGQYTSMALDADGFPVVSYYDAGNKNLKLLHCNDPNCAGGDDSIESPDTAGDVGLYTSLALDFNGFPVVSYFDSGQSDLKILHCNDPNCAGGDEAIESPDTADQVGWFTSLALDSDGFPVVSYFDSSNGDLKLLHCNDPNCAGGDESITSPDTGNIALGTSLALDSQGYPVVSYRDFDTGMKILHCNDANCSGDDESITIPAEINGVVFDPSLTLDGNGFPVVSFTSDRVPETLNSLMLLHCNDPDCAGNDDPIHSPDTVGNVGFDSSLTLDSSGFPVVSYYDISNNDLKFMRCNDPNCAGDDDSIMVPDGPLQVGSDSSLALDDQEFGVVSYHDTTNVDLKLLHCATADCKPPVPTATPTPTVTPTPDPGTCPQDVCLYLPVILSD